MGVLTDRTTLGNPALGDIIHVVDISDTTDGPEGTSKKAALQALKDLFIVSKTLFISNADVTVSNTVVETALTGVGVGSLTIPAANLKANAKFALKAQGIISDAGNPAFQLRVKLGGVLIGDTGSQTLGAITNDHWIVNVEFMVRSEGATGKIMSVGAFLTSKNDHFALVNTSEITIDTTVAQVLTVTAEWGTASTGNTVTLQILELDQFNVA